jgi:hypothetical protein
MIYGNDSKTSKALSKAVTKSCIAANGKEKSIKEAVAAEIALLVHHQKMGHQTNEELFRSGQTVHALKNGLRRFNFDRRFYA